MKELNDAGIINAAAAVGTLLAVIVALLPSISRWWRRPKLRLEIPPDHYRVSSKNTVEGTTLLENMVAFGAPGAPTLSEPHKFFCSAALVIRNTGVSAAVGTRVVVTDVYALASDGSITVRDFSQRHIAGVEELPGGLIARFVVVNRIRIDNHDSRFVIGRPLTATVSTINMTRTVGFSPAGADIQVWSPYIVRLIVSASNSRAKSHLVTLDIAADESIKLYLPARGVTKNIKRVDRQRTRPQVSAGG